MTPPTVDYAHAETIDTRLSNEKLGKRLNVHVHIAGNKKLHKFILFY